MWHGGAAKPAPLRSAEHNARIILRGAVAGGELTAAGEAGHVGDVADDDGAAAVTALLKVSRRRSR